MSGLGRRRFEVDQQRYSMFDYLHRYDTPDGEGSASASAVAVAGKKRRQADHEEIPMETLLTLVELNFESTPGTAIRTYK